MLKPRRLVLAPTASAADAEAIVTEGLEQVNRYHFELLLPQILRAQAILLARRGARGRLAAELRRTARKKVRVARNLAGCE